MFLARIETRLNKLLLLQEGELKRLLPFFFIFCLIFIVITIGEGMAIALFISNIGATNLPTYYCLGAITTFVFTSIYMLFVDRIRHDTLFVIILFMSALALFLGWCIMMFCGEASWLYGFLYLHNEVVSNILLIHFNVYFREFFQQQELLRILPIVYTGGRLGGIIGGIFLTTLSSSMHIINFAFLNTVILVMITIYVLVSVRNSQSSVSLICSKQTRNFRELYQEAGVEFVQFINFLKGSSLLHWLSIGTVLFIMYKCFINFQYNQYFEQLFNTEESLTKFIGQYTIIALILATIIQLVLTNRAIIYLGIKFAGHVYNVIMIFIACMQFTKYNLVVASITKFVESDLRNSYRNPIVMLIANQYPQKFRGRARAISTGVVIPLGYLCSGSVIHVLLQTDYNSIIIPVSCLFLGLLNLLACHKLYKHYG